MKAETKHLSDLEIEALLDEALEGRAGRAAHAHLAVCAECERRATARADLFAALESWEDSPPSRDLAPGIVRRLSQRRIPFGLSVATALQAVLALFIAAIAWPLVADLLSSVPLPAIPGAGPGASEILTAQLGELVNSSQAALQPFLDAADAWLRLAPRWMALSPAIVAGALLVAVLGNSILLAGDATGRRGIRPRRL
jgi:hypothetical protein